MRNIIEVLERIEEIAPELVKFFEPVKNKSRYTAPEAALLRWMDAEKILNREAQNHPRKAEILRIWNGTDAT